MVLIRRRATSKASLIRALRANNIRFSSVRTLKRARRRTTGLYLVNIIKRRRR